MNIIEFKELKLSDKALFKHFTNNYINSESSFANLLMWKKIYNSQYAIIDDALILKYCHPNNKVYYSMPYTNSNSVISPVEKLLKYNKTTSEELVILDANKQFIDSITKYEHFSVEYEQNRDYQEYVYLSERLATLQGKELHQKKNHVNKFKSLYDYKYVPIDNSMLKICLKKTNEWLTEKYRGDTSAFANEYLSVKCAIDNFDYFELFGGAIIVDNNLVAFSIGEKKTNNTALIHIEKADKNYNGAFAIINYEFSNYLKDRFIYINREEDMGIEGLRKAKMSYKPEFLTDKYKCVIKED